MLSIRAMNATQAGSYFSKEDYYIRDAELGANSMWCGGGTRELGLEGEVGEDAFRALCRGEDPGGNRIIFYQLSYDESGAPVEKHRAGIDCTYSASKSVGIAYAAGIDEAKEAHDAAVLTMARYMERHYCFYKESGELKHGSLTAAKFDHATSRNSDPQLHTHLFVLNVVGTPDGTWRAAEMKGILLDLKRLGFLYRVELARELEARGFEIVVLNRSQMFFELKGIDPRLIEYFSSRRKEIQAQVELWKAEGKFGDVPHGRLYEMATLETRDPKRAITREEVARIFEAGFQACGTSSAEVRRELEMSLAPKLTEPQRPPELTPAGAVQLAARDLTERKAVVERARLLDQTARISGTRFGAEELDAAIEAGVEGVLRLGRNSRGREFYTTSTMLELEAGNLEKVRQLAGTPFYPAVREGETDAFRERLALEDVRPTAGQWREFENEVAGGSSFTLTRGDPGTAKTSTLGLIERFNEEVLRPDGREPCTVNLAYTGKAAREMNLATGHPGFTVDSFLNAASKFDLQRAKSEEAILEVAGKKILISRDRPLVVRVDEAGLLGARQARDLLRVVEELREREVQVKLHLLGDTKQMQAISAGDFLRQVEELGKRGEVEFAHLSEILRQRDPEMLELARGLNREDRPLAENAREAVAALGKGGRLTEIASEPELRGAAVRHYLEESRKPSQVPKRALAGEGQTVLMMTGTNAQRRELNREVREARIAAGEIGEGKRFAVLAPVHQGVTVECYRLGDTVLFPGVLDENRQRRSWGARIGIEGEVVGLDRERNLVRVRYSFETEKSDGRVLERTVTRDFSAAEMAGRTALFREEERNFAVGDRIVALKNDGKLELENGDLGTIRELDGRGRAVVDLGARSVELDLSRYRQVDHAYAVTYHKGQGSTVEYSIMVAPVRPDPERGKGPDTGAPAGEESYGHLSYNSFNVAVTRAQFGTHVFTNSLDGFTKAVQIVDTGSSALTGGVEREARRELPGKVPGLGEPTVDLAEQIRRLGMSVPGPGKKLPRLTVESIRVPELSVSRRDLFKPVPVVPAVQKAVQKEVGRELERALTRKIGLELER